MFIKTTQQQKHLTQTMTLSKPEFQHTEQWYGNEKQILWNCAPGLGLGSLSFPIYTSALCDHIGVYDFHEPPLKCWFDFQILNSSLHLIPKTQIHYRSLPVRSWHLGIPTSSNSNSAHPNRCSSSHLNLLLLQMPCDVRGTTTFLHAQATHLPVTHPHI